MCLTDVTTEDLLRWFIATIFMGLFVRLFYNKIEDFFKKHIENPKILGVVSNTVTILFFSFFIILIVYIIMLIYCVVPSIDCSRYGFEDSVWKTSEDPNRGVGISSPGISTYKKIRGKSSMSVNVKLDGTQTGRQSGRHQGEVYVDPRFVPPKGVPPEGVRFLVLSGKTIAASVFVPQELVGQIPGKPLYLQLFVEECDPPLTRSDSPPTNIIMAGKPRLEFKVPILTRAICKIGIKIGLNDEDNNTYEGDLYVDAVDWK